MPKLMHARKTREDEGVEYYWSFSQSEHDQHDGNIILVVNQYNKGREEAYKFKESEPRVETRDAFLCIKKASEKDEGFTLSIRNIDADGSQLSPDSALTILIHKSAKIKATLTFQKVSMTEAFSCQVEAAEIVIRDLENDKCGLQSTMKKITVEKNLMEDTLYRAFTKCLNAKKEKIRQLQQQKGDNNVGTAQPLGIQIQNKKYQNKLATRRRRVNNFSDTSDSESESDNDSGLCGNLLGDEKLYNLDTDTEEKEEVNTSDKSVRSNVSPAVAVVVPSSSSSGTETDFSLGEDDDRLKAALVKGRSKIFEQHGSSSSSSIYKKRKSPNRVEAPSDKLPKVVSSIPDKSGSDSEDLFDHELLLNDL